MTVLVVRKITNFEIHGPAIIEKVKAGNAPQSALDRLTIAHEEHYATLQSVRDELSQHRIAFHEITRDDPLPAPEGTYRCIITVGGDGTLLTASHKFTDTCCLLGVRSSRSSVGYLCFTGNEGVGDAIRSFATDQLEPTLVSRFAADVYNSERDEVIRTVPVFNDFLYTNTNPAATTRYRIEIDGVGEDHRSSGIWFATGAGSTAAILAAGGEKRPLDDPHMQYLVRELYQLDGVVKHHVRGLLDVAKTELVIENRCQHAILAVDGQHGVVPLSYNDRLKFRKAKPVELVRKRTPVA